MTRGEEAGEAVGRVQSAENDLLDVVREIVARRGQRMDHLRVERDTASAEAERSHAGMREVALFRAANAAAVAGDVGSAMLLELREALGMVVPTSPGSQATS